MRNSSLVEGSCAENVTGLKSAAEAVDVQVQAGTKVEACSQGTAAGKAEGTSLENLVYAWAW